MMGQLGNPEQEGLIPRSSSLIFQSILSDDAGTEFTIKISMLEIYKEALKDLLFVSDEKLKIKETAEGISVTGLSEEYVGSEQELLERIEFGQENRTVACTKMNSRSSRSHQLFVIKVQQRCEDGVEKIGTLNLVDLAGSEKISASGVKGLGLEEAKKINLSLSMLGHVIHQLSQGASHIPYRDSKLTRLLQESLGGNFKTRLLVACSPHIRNLEESISTLKFAQRAKTVKTKAKMNLKEAPDVVIARLTRQLEEAFAYIEELKRMLGKAGDISVPIISVQSECFDSSPPEEQPYSQPEVSQGSTQAESQSLPQPNDSSHPINAEGAAEPQPEHTEADAMPCPPTRVYTKPKCRSLTHFQRSVPKLPAHPLQKDPNLPPALLSTCDTFLLKSDISTAFPAKFPHHFHGSQPNSPQLDVIPDVDEDNPGKFSGINDIQRNWETLRMQYSIHLRAMQRQIADLSAHKLTLKHKISQLREQNQHFEQFIMGHLEACHHKKQEKGCSCDDKDKEIAVLKNEVRGLTQRLMEGERRAGVEQRSANFVEMEEFLSCDSSFVRTT